MIHLLELDRSAVTQSQQCYQAMPASLSSNNQCQQCYQEMLAALFIGFSSATKQCKQSSITCSRKSSLTSPEELDEVRAVTSGLRSSGSVASGAFSRSTSSRRGWSWTRRLWKVFPGLGQTQSFRMRLGTHTRNKVMKLWQNLGLDRHCIRASGNSEISEPSLSFSPCWYYYLLR